MNDCADACALPLRWPGDAAAEPAPRPELHAPEDGEGAWRGFLSPAEQAAQTRAAAAAARRQQDDLKRLRHAPRQSAAAAARAAAKRKLAFEERSTRDEEACARRQELERVWSAALDAASRCSSAVQ